jgi:class 3 adenylate cyclase/tetratricopeptide (TPR) repeat protein
MRCLNCSFINQDDAKFCQQCGKPLERVCPYCKTHNSLDAKFCKNCGKYLLQELSQNQPTSEKIETPQQPRYTGMNSHSEIEKRSPAHSAGERRIVTVLFADVVDSTSMADQMDPEDWTAVMNRAFDILTPVITRYEGTIARLMGDAILAFFGAPVAHEDDPIRAGRAALDLIQAAREYAQELHPHFGIDFGIRVGLNTGPVVVGEVGSNLAYEYTAMGDAVNLAARMQAAAHPMTVLITERTYRFLAQAFDCTDLGKIAVKGKLEPVHVYELGNPNPQYPGSRRLTEQEGSMVGREKELGLLMQVGRVVQAGLGRGVLLVGEPGIGKSRLVNEWKSRTNDLQMPDTAETAWLEGHSLSYGQGMPYHLLVDLMHSVLKIHPNAGSSETLAALQALCDDLFGEGKKVVFPFLGALMSLPLEGNALERVRILDPQALQAQYFTALSRLITALAEREPLYIVLDDIQWADPSSIDLLVHLVPIVLQTRILLCIVSRPDRDAAGWKLVESLREQMGAGLIEINLAALSETESSQLILKLLDTASLPKSVNDLICSSSDGNPLFVEEVIHMLVDRHILTRQDKDWQVAKEIETVEIPDNLQSLLLARIDRLPEGARHTLRVASIIGRQFSVDLLEKVLKRLAPDQGKNTHLVQLTQLESSGLIALASSSPEIEYTFRHALIQDAVYGSLLKSEQHGLHLIVGETLEEIQADHPTDRSNRLAEHFWLAGQPERALPYFLISAEQAARSYANTEAIENYSRALQAAEQDPASMAAVLRARGELYETIGEFEHARLDQEKALELSQSSQDTRGEWQALINLGALWSARDYQETGAYYGRALALARTLADDRILATSLNRIGNYYGNVVKPLESQESHHEALNLFTQLEDERGIAETNDLLGMSNALSGDGKQAMEHFTQAVVLFEKLGDLRSLSSSLAAKSILASDPQMDTFVLTKLSLQEAIELGERSLQIAKEIGWRSGQAFSLCTLMELLVGAGRYDRALECMQNGAEIIEKIQHRQWRTYLDIVSGMFYFDLYSFEKSKACFETALEMAQLSHSTHWIHVIYGLLADTLIMQNDLASAESLLGNIQTEAIPNITLGGRLAWAARADLALANDDAQPALEIVKQMMEAASYSENDVAVRLWMLRAEAFIVLAQNEADPVEKGHFLTTAQDLLITVLAEAQGLNYRSKIWQIHKALAKVYHLQNRNAESEKESQVARNIVLELADTIRDADMRENYINCALAV